MRELKTGCPPRMTTTYGDRYNVTLDWVELFDGLPLDSATGHLKTTDDEGNYLVYNDEKQLFANAEPRLKGSIMMPGETYKGVCLDIRSGLIKEDVKPQTDKIAKFEPDDGQTTTPWKNNTWFKNHLINHSTNQICYQVCKLPLQCTHNGKSNHMMHLHHYITPF